MSKSSAFMLNLNDVVTFHDDGSLPQETQNQSFKVTRIDTLLLNDFYFNQELFPSYELTGESGNKIQLSPFKFEEEELKLRITKNITMEDLHQLCKPHHPKELFNLQQDENNYFSIDDANIQSSLKNWVGRTYYVDIKEQDVATSTYIQFDSANKKNLNYTLLLKKYPFATYSLFLGDYNTFYLEVNFEQTPQVRVTTFLSLSDIESIETKERTKEEVRV
ncbi:MAG: hypothetical protein HYX61_06445 [Gammaproteobacteria bacterium]|jgi:hypothetical protein|nr:hypothetical protein [Gammaproteobacteria bacterium]